MCDECVWVTIIVTATVSVHRSPPSGRYAPFRGSTDFSRGLRCWYTTRVTRLVTHTECPAGFAAVPKRIAAQRTRAAVECRLIEHVRRGIRQLSSYLCLFINGDE